jgi:hypothetical protein
MYPLALALQKFWVASESNGKLRIASPDSVCASLGVPVLLDTTAAYTWPAFVRFGEEHVQARVESEEHGRDVPRVCPRDAERAAGLGRRA